VSGPRCEGAISLWSAGFKLPGWCPFGMTLTFGTMDTAYEVTPTDDHSGPNR
jgi:hypothetical protein